MVQSTMRAALIGTTRVCTPPPALRPNVMALCCTLKRCALTLQTGVSKLLCRAVMPRTVPCWFERLRTSLSVVRSSLDNSAELECSVQELWCWQAGAYCVLDVQAACDGAVAAMTQGHTNCAPGRG